MERIYKGDPMEYDSTEDTKAHIKTLQDVLGEAIGLLVGRSLSHDASKLEEPEKSLYDKYTPLLRGTTYGTPIYYQYLEEMGAALSHHYENNSHHPEHYHRPDDPEITEIVEYIDRLEKANPEDRALPWLYAYLSERRSRINGMSLLDVLEMLADWKAAGMRHADGSIEQSLEINRERFEISDQLFEILKNTVRELEW
jgi:hypothetical protein